MKFAKLVLATLFAITLTACTLGTNDAGPSNVEPSKTNDSNTSNVNTNAESDAAKKKNDYTEKRTRFNAALKQYANENFGIEGFETSWYKNIKSYSVNITDESTTVEVTVTKETNEKTARSIFSMVMGFINDQTQTEYKADEIVITTEDKKTILSEINPHN